MYVLHPPVGTPASFPGNNLLAETRITQVWGNLSNTIIIAVIANILIFFSG